MRMFEFSMQHRLSAIEILKKYCNTHTRQFIPLKTALGKAQSNHSAEGTPDTISGKNGRTTDMMKQSIHSSPLHLSQSYCIKCIDKSPVK